jgi:MazG family protein
MRPGESLADLVQVMKRLLAPDGCPWDREQTLASLKPYLVEETYEVLEVRAAEGKFGIDDVVSGIADKLVRRHPHVFGDTKLQTSGQVLDQWSKLKEKEKPRRTLDGVPKTLPALARAQKLSERAGAVGFDWPDAAGARAKVVEELGEIDRAAEDGDPAALEHEIGDLFFAAVSLARKLGVDPEGALRAANGRFSSRFEYIEDRLRERGKSPRDSDLREMDALWDEAKRARHADVTEK